MAIVWFYGFESVFCQVLFDFLFVVYLLFHLLPLKKLNTGTIVHSTTELFALEAIFLFMQ